MHMPSQNLDLLVRQFPGKILLSLSEAGLATGRCGKTVRNEIALGIFPVQTVKVGKRRLVPIAALAEYLDSLTTPSRGPGRPRSAREGV